MARGITETDVHTAADALVAAGERPTVERIRAHLGTGSPNTVTRWLETWWQSLGVRLAGHADKVALPEAPAAVAALATQLWEQALAAAQQQAQAALDAERSTLAQDQVQLADERAQLGRQLQAYQAATAQAQREHALAEIRLTDAERLSTLQAEQLADLGRQRDDLYQRAARLEQELEGQRTRLHELEAGAATERESQRQHVQNIEERAHTEVDRARQETKLARVELASLAKRLEMELQAARQREEMARQTLAQNQLELASVRARADALAEIKASAPTRRRRSSQTVPQGRPGKHATRKP